MSSQTGNPFSAINDGDSTRLPWSSVANASGAVNGLYANVNLTVGNTASQLLIATNLTSGISIPAQQTILGVSFSYYGYMSSAGGHQTYARLIVNGSLVGTIHTINNPLSTITGWTPEIGGSNDLWGVDGVYFPSWGALTPTTINQTNFGVAFNVVTTDATARNYYVDAIRVTVYYGYYPSVYLYSRNSKRRFYSTRNHHLKVLSQTSFRGAA